MQNYIAIVAHGLEQVVFDEIKALGGQNINIVFAGVTFEAENHKAYELCLSSRFASRIVQILAVGTVKNDKDLYDLSYSLPWEKIFDSRNSFVIDFKGTNKSIKNSYYGALKLKDSIADRFLNIQNESINVDKETPDFRIHVRLIKNEVIIGFDMCGDPLHQRGYRSESGIAPLRETHAAALIEKSKWDEEKFLMDPMCGSGTILIEAALQKKNIPVNFFRKKWGFQFLKNFDSNVLINLKENLKKSFINNFEEKSIIGFDSSPKVINIAKKNARIAQVSDIIEFKVQNIDDLESIPNFNNGVIISNPPYGERMGTHTDLIKLYTKLGAKLKRYFGGSNAFIYSSNEDLLNCLGMRAFKSLKLRNGKLDCILKSYSIKAREYEEYNEGTSDNNANLNIAIDFQNRLKKNIKLISKWAKLENVHAYRIYDADLPDYKVAIDKYNDYFVVQEYAAPKKIDEKKAKRRLTDILRVLMEVTNSAPNKICLKHRERKSGKSQYEKISSNNNFMNITENNLKFMVNLHDYLDTGIFLDHRKTRQLIYRMSANKDVLNLFAYTGSASVYAAAGNAKSVVTVDMSKTYLDWSKSNMKMNGFIGSQYKFENENCMLWLQKSTMKFDFIFIDPPTFSNSKKMENTFEVERDHVDLLLLASNCLKQDGVILFTNNKRNFKLNNELLNSNGLSAREITNSTIPEDFKRNKKIHNSWLLNFN